MIRYFSDIQELLTDVCDKEERSVEKIATEIKDRLDQGGIIQLFGCGHSHLLAAEGYYRAGSLVPVQPIFIESLMLHGGAVESSNNEKNPDFINTFAHRLDFKPQDVVIIISNSGRNPVPIDVALLAKEAGAYTVSIQSLHYNEEEHPSKHKSGSRLEGVVDAKLNTHIPLGDSILSSNDSIFGPASSVIANVLLHGTFSRVIELMIEDGAIPPIFRSGNLEGNKEHNDKMIEQYSKRIQF